MKKQLLVIDGMYFAHRAIHTLNMGETINNLETKQEQQAFTVCLNSQMVNLLNIFKPFVNQVVFVTDNFSWRKEITPIKPYWVTDDRVLGYKEQRKESKEKSDINYDNFNNLFSEFTESLKSKMIVFDIKGLEGDDNIMLISDKLKDSPIWEGIVFCTDGDLEQCVRNNFMLFRNIKSNDAPYGEFTITSKKYLEVFNELSIEDQFLQNNNIDKYKKLFKISSTGLTNVERELNKGISIATPFKLALIKSISGDKKDNIFPIISWPAKTGTKYFKVTENHIEKALREIGKELTEKNCAEIIMDKDELLTLVNSILKITGQPQTNLKKILEHLQHNMKINILSKNNVPKQYVDNFNINWELITPLINSQDFDFDLFTKLTSNVNQKDSAINLLEQSIPEII